MNSTTTQLAKTLKSVFDYSYLLMFALGVPGSILMYFVFSRKTLSKLSISLYFRAMALANIYVCLNSIKKFFEDEYHFDLSGKSVYLCKGHTFIFYWTSSMSIWFLVAAGLDRFFIIAYPIKFQFIQRGRFPFYCISVLIVYNLVFYINLLFTMNLVTTMSKSSKNSTQIVCKFDFYTFFIVSNLVNAKVIPFLIMIFTTFGMSLVIYNSQSRMNHFQNSTTCSKRKRRNLKISLSMVITNVVFLLTVAPSSINYLVDWDSGFNAGTLFRIMYYSFYSISFYLQIAVNYLVRHEFLEFFKKIFSHKFKFS